MRSLLTVSRGPGKASRGLRLVTVIRDEFHPSNFSSHELLRQYAGMLSELRARGVIRTLNAPSGDLAETLTERAYQGELAPDSEKSWDVRAAGGRFLQVKSRVSAADETVAARSTSTKRLTSAATSSSAHSTPSNSGADSPLARTNSPSPTEAELSGRHHRLATWIGRHTRPRRCAR